MAKFAYCGFALTITVVIFGVIQSVECATEKLVTISPGEGPERAKGDLAEFMTASKPSVSKVPPKWDDLKLKTSVTGSHRNKGDLGIIDPRGTVRYNIMENGRISRGVITSLADDEYFIKQAKSECCPADTYAPMANKRTEYLD